MEDSGICMSESNNLNRNVNGIRDLIQQNEGSTKGLLEHIALKALQNLSLDSAGRLRIAAESVVSHAVTLTTLTNLTNWGLRTATAITQQESDASYQQGFRRNLTVS